VEFARYLVHPERWERLPADWPGLFGREARLAVEVGFGNGEFLAGAAQEHPDWNWVGFETSLTCIVKAGRKLARAGAENVRLARAEGRFALRELFPDETVGRVFVHFPCPWPKTRHAERRVMDSDFSRTLSAVLTPGGSVELTTDVRAYAQDVGQVLAAQGFRVVGPAPVDVAGPGTRYEAKWRAQGRGIWRVTADRGQRGSTLRTAEGAMPHVRIRSVAKRDAVEQLVGLRESWPGGAFAVQGAFFSPDGRATLLRTFASDDGYQQHYLLVVAREQEGTMVKLDGAATPFRTPAVKRSVAAVAAALEER